MSPIIMCPDQTVDRRQPVGQNPRQRRPHPLRRYGTGRARERPLLYYYCYCPETVSLLQRSPMQPAPPAKDVLLLVHDVDVPKSERDVDLELADADIAMHPVTGKFPSTSLPALRSSSAWHFPATSF